MCRTTCKVDLHDLFKTHMHQLEIHIPFTWRLCHPRNNIAEQEESDWYYDRFIRQQRTFGGDGTTRQIAVGQYCKKQVKEHIGDSPADLAKRLLDTRSNKPLFVSKVYADTVEFTHFLWSIRDYLDGSWYEVLDNGSVRFFTRAEETDLVITGFHSQQSVESEMDAMWRRNQESHPTDVLVSRLRALSFSFAAPLERVPYREWRKEDLKVHILSRIEMMGDQPRPLKHLFVLVSSRKEPKPKKDELANLLSDDDVLLSETQ